MPTVAAIKIAQKKAGITDTQYRAMLSFLCGVTSSTALDDQGRSIIYDAIRQINPDAVGSQATAAERKLWALWYQLKPQLPESCRTVQYLVGICCKANHPGCHISTISELTSAQIHSAIEALKKRLVQS